MLKHLLSAAALLASSLTLSVGYAESLPSLDNTKPWSIRMIESEMTRFPEAWQIDWDEKPQWDYVHGLNLLAITEVYKKTKNPDYLRYVEGYYDMLVNEDGSIKSFDYNGISGACFNLLLITSICLPILQSDISVGATRPTNVKKSCLA